jgi:Tetratricopeptide repeat
VRTIHRSRGQLVRPTVSPAATSGGEPEAGSRLAGSLSNLSNRLADLGRREEALAAGQEAADLYRELAAARPDAFGPNLASSLNNLSVRLAALGGGRRRWPPSSRP